MFEVILKLSIIVLTGFFPGFCLLNMLNFLKLSKEEIITSSFGIGFLMLGASSYLAFILNITEPGFFNSFVIFSLFAFCLYYFLYYRRKWRGCFSQEKDRITRFYKCVLTMCCLYMLNIFAFECILPVFAGGGWYIDWLNHYKVTMFFNRVIPFEKIVLERTPLYSLIQAFFLSIFSNSFWEFQLVNVLLGSIFLLSMYLVAEKLYGSKIGTILLGVVFMNPWCMHLSWFTWPKMCVVYFVMLSLYFYLSLWDVSGMDIKRKRSCIFLSGLFASLGFLVHPFALFYTITVFIDLLFFRRQSFSLGKRFRIILTFLSFMVALSLPWYIYTVSTYGLRDTILSSPVFSFQTYQSNTLLNFAVSRLHNAIFSIVPFHVIITLLWKQFIGVINTGYIVNALSEYYFNPLTGCLTFTGTFVFILTFIRYLFYTKPEDRVLDKYKIKAQYLFIIPTLLCVLIMVYILAVFLNNESYFKNVFIFYPLKVFKLLCFTSVSLILGGFIASYVCVKRRLFIYLNNDYITIGLLALVSYVLAVLVHPGVDWHGVVHNTMIPVALIILLLLSKIMSGMKLPYRLCVFSGLVFEMCVGIWFYVFMLLNSAAFKADPNWGLKFSFKINYLSDILGNNYILCFILFAVCIEIIGILIFAGQLFYKSGSYQ